MTNLLFRLISVCKKNMYYTVYFILNINYKYFKK